MSDALAIAGTSAVLQNVLQGILNGAGLGSVTVTAVAPDVVQNLQGTSPTLRVNLFLHQVTPNAAWRNAALPILAADGRTPLRNQPLALDLHYLLTAYGTLNFEAEALLGYAVQALHLNPVLTRDFIRSALNALNPAPANDNTSLDESLYLAGLADQVEMLKITPATLGREEVAWLWTALKSDYRPTFPFQVSVVLIQAQNPAQSALPVLQRSISAQANLVPTGPGLPMLMAVTPPKGQPAASPMDLVTVTGVNLAGMVIVVLTNSRRGITLTLAATNVSAGSFQFNLTNPQPPTNPPDVAAGIYQLSGQGATANLSTTNTLPFAVAPTITNVPLPAITVDAQGNATVNITCAPYLRPDQEAMLLIGGQSAPVTKIANATNSLTFSFTGLQTSSTAVPVRLRVDGVDSPIIDFTQTQPAFTGPTVVVNP